MIVPTRISSTIQPLINTPDHTSPRKSLHSPLSSLKRSHGWEHRARREYQKTALSRWTSSYQGTTTPGKTKEIRSTTNRTRRRYSHLIPPSTPPFIPEPDRGKGLPCTTVGCCCCCCVAMIGGANVVSAGATLKLGAGATKLVL
jgi:hypothetical protein